MIIAVTGYRPTYILTMAKIDKTPDVLPREISRIVEITEMAQLANLKGYKLIGFPHADMDQRSRLLCEVADFTVIGPSAARFIAACHRIINPPVINRDNPKEVRPL